MERMTKGEGMTPEEYIAMVEEENKKLRAYADNLDSENDNQAIEIEELKKENRNLKKKVRFLEECLDRKEKAEGVKFYVEKASDRSYKGEVEINTLEDLLKFIKKNGKIIITDDLWYLSEETQKKYKYGIKIYDFYIE